MIVYKAGMSLCSTKPAQLLHRKIASSACQPICVHVPCRLLMNEPTDDMMHRHVPVHKRATTTRAMLFLIAMPLHQTGFSDKYENFRSKCYTEWQAKSLNDLH